MKSVVKSCACTSGLAYAKCCEPYHRGQREAPDATALMRSRFSAFALDLPDYLWRTLDATHADRSRDRATVLGELHVAASTFKYMRLAVLDARGGSALEADARAQVLFHASIFERGRDRSFVELSEFAHDGVGWRYVSGRFFPRERFPRDLTGLTIARLP